MTIKYDAEFVDEVLSLDQTISVELARALGKKYHKETEMNLALQSWKTQSPYRKPDLTNLVHGVLSQEKVSRKESLEEKAMVPYEQKSLYQTIADIVKTISAGTVDWTNKTCWYYPFVGALRAEHQEKLAKKLGDNQSYYTVANHIFESVGFGLAASYSLYLSGGGLANSIGVGIMSGIFVCLLAGEIIRERMASESRHKAYGSLFAMPFYALYYAASAIGKSYTSAWEKRKQKKTLLEQKVKPRTTATPVVDATFVEIKTTAKAKADEDGELLREAEQEVEEFLEQEGIVVKKTIAG